MVQRCWTEGCMDECTERDDVGAVSGAIAAIRDLLTV